MNLDGQQPKQLPTIMVGWDKDLQTVHLAFDTKEFTNWPFMIAVLGMALKEAEAFLRIAQVEHLEKQRSAGIEPAGDILNRFRKGLG